MEPQSEEDPQVKKRNSKAHLQKKYGILPSRGDLLGHQLENRTFFDSGDFALSKARRPSGMGSVVTGSQHPCRETISHPFCPVPSLSNVGERSNEGLQRQEKGSDMKSKSHLDEMETDETSRS